MATATLYICPFILGASTRGILDELVKKATIFSIPLYAIHIIMDKIIPKLKELFGIDVRTLALLRVGTALIVIIDLIDRARFLTALYTENGVLPLTLLEKIENNFFTAYNLEGVSIHTLNDTFLFQATLFVVAGIFAGMMLIGWKTTFATIATWFLLVSLHSKNPLVLYGADAELRMILFWAMFLPWGKVFSVDSAFSYKKVGAVSREVVCSPASLALLFQVGFIYFFAALLKTGDAWRIDGTAISLALHIDRYTNSLSYLLLLAPPIFLTGLTFFVFWLQRFSMFFLFFPFDTRIVRTTTMVLLIFMQIGFGTFLGIGIFPVVSICALWVFLHPSIWDWFFKKIATPERIGFALYYDGECGFCKKSVYLLKTFFLISETHVSPAVSDERAFKMLKEKNSWVARDFRGKQYTAFEAFIALTSVSPILLWLTPFLRIPCITHAGERVYRLIAQHRPRVCIIPSKVTVTWKSLKIERYSKVFFFWIVPIGAFLLVIFANISTVHPVPLSESSSIYREAKNLVYSFHLNQKWNMFAPQPSSMDGWFVIPATLHNGTVVDAYSGNVTVDWRKPENIRAVRNSARLERYVQNLLIHKDARAWEQYASWICYDWNHNKSSQDTQIDTITITHMEEKNTVETLHDPAVKVEVLANYSCSPEATAFYISGH